MKKLELADGGAARLLRATAQEAAEAEMLRQSWDGILEFMCANRDKCGRNRKLGRWSLDSAWSPPTRKLLLRELAVEVESVVQCIPWLSLGTRITGADAI
ncbi:hypothetical protein [Aureliella helgolandensis]|uniref:hypothetical protein n=1 Tax=Aureliella helgolandensis TaxID=2527968 RepID=UPI0018D1116B|nr:hypothetical protein [Aureliella helgolandensis]